MNPRLSYLFLCFILFLACQPIKKDQTFEEKPIDKLAQTAELLPQNDTKGNQKPVRIGPASDEEKAEINRQFGNFKNAILNYNGIEAAACLSKESLKYYQYLMDLAHAKLTDADNYKGIQNRLSPSVQANVALMASRFGAAYLKSAKPEEIYALAFKEGWIGYKTFLTAAIDKIERYEEDNEILIIADYYYEDLLKDKQIPRIAFRLQDGQWRIDLTPLFIAIDMAVKNYIKEEQIDVQDAIQRSVIESNEALNPKQWKFYKKEEHGFAAKFPSSPLYEENAPYHNFKAETAMNLFGILHRNYDKEIAANPLKDSKIQDYELHNLFVPLEVDDNLCNKASNEKALRISCQFASTKNAIKGKSDFYFLEDKVYIVYAVSNNSSFGEKLAQSFLKSFLIL